MPHPESTVKEAVPNACNQCHLDKSVNWAIRESKRMWPPQFANAYPSTDDVFDQPEGVRALFAGDALTRSMAAEALGGGGPMKLDTLSTLPFLIEACADDYPIVRFFALQGIASQEPRLGKPDYLAPPPAQIRIGDQLWQKLLALRPDQSTSLRDRAMTLAQMLRKRRTNVDLQVGE